MTHVPYGHQTGRKWPVPSGKQRSHCPGCGATVIVDLNAQGYPCATCSAIVVAEAFAHERVTCEFCSRTLQIGVDCPCGDKDRLGPFAQFHYGASEVPKT